MSTIYRGYDIIPVDATSAHRQHDYIVTENGAPLHRASSEENAMKWIDAKRRGSKGST